MSEALTKPTVIRGTLLFFLFLCWFSENFSIDIDTTGRKVEFYPASLMISHNVQPILFFSDTKIMHLVTKLTAIPPGPKFRMNNTCSPSQNSFYDKLLSSIQHTQNVIHRLLSLPGLTNLLECDSYLRRFFKYSTGLSGQMICPRAYRSSLAECKIWALSHCQAISLNERLFLDPSSVRSRSKRSWMCHAGLFGLFRAIYESTGRSCEPNHVENLKSTLKEITAAIGTSQSLIRTLHGKLVYIVKTTDSLATKTNQISRDLKEIDHTFRDWEIQMNQFAKQERCNFRTSLEFFSKHSTAVSRAFMSLLRLTEIQNIIHQFHKLAKQSLFGSSDLPEFLSGEIRRTMDSNSNLYFTAKAFSKGFPVMVNPMIDIEHTGAQVEASLLFTIPEISNLKSFCTLEYLSPLKFNFSNTCYEGPITKKNLVLITCPKSRQLTTVQALEKCYKNSDLLLCPEHLLQTATNTSFLGVPFNPDIKLTFPRNHVRAIDCSNIHPLVHLGGRYFLSTSTMPLMLSSGTITTSPFMIYHIPCNVTFAGMTTGLGRCPSSLTITVPIFTKQKFQYIPWRKVADDQSILHLHHQTLSIPPQTNLNHSVLEQLEETYRTLDGLLTTQLSQTNADIDKIHKTSQTSTTEIVAYSALGLSIFNLIFFGTLIYFLRSSPPAKRCTRCHRHTPPTCKVPDGSAEDTAVPAET